MVIHLEHRLPGASSDLPGSNGRTTLLTLPYLVLLQVGFTKLSMSPSRLVSSYLTVSPLPLHDVAGWPPEAVSSLWHFPSRCRDWALPSTLSCGARTFLPPELSQASDHSVRFSNSFSFLTNPQKQPSPSRVLPFRARLLRKQRASGLPMCRQFTTSTSRTPHDAWSCGLKMIRLQKGQFIIIHGFFCSSIVCWGGILMLHPWQSPSTTATTASPCLRSRRRS